MSHQIVTVGGGRLHSVLHSVLQLLNNACETGSWILRTRTLFLETASKLACCLPCIPSVRSGSGSSATSSSPLLSVIAS